jgi:ABC-type uncharacterized transport system permease subunit
VPAVAARAWAKRRGLLLLAWLLHGLLLAWSLLGGTPRFGFAPALSITAWLVLTVYAVKASCSRKCARAGRWPGWARGGAAGAAVSGHAAARDTASPWLPLHWALGIASYGLFAAAVVHAWLMRRAEKADPPCRTRGRRAAADAGAADLPLCRRRLCAAVGHAAGRAAVWRTAVRRRPRLAWDHKTVFSLLSWLAFAVLLLGRARFGWRGRKAVRVLYAGSLLLLLAYAGSRFVLEVVLGRPS